MIIRLRQNLSTRAVHGAQVTRPYRWLFTARFKSGEPSAHLGSELPQFAQHKVRCGVRPPAGEGQELFGINVEGAGHPIDHLIAPRTLLAGLDTREISGGFTS